MMVTTGGRVTSSSLVVSCVSRFSNASFAISSSKLMTWASAPNCRDTSLISSVSSDWFTVTNTPRCSSVAIRSLARNSSFSARSFTLTPSVTVMLRVIGTGPVGTCAAPKRGATIPFIGPSSTFRSDCFRHAVAHVLATGDRLFREEALYRALLRCLDGERQNLAAPACPDVNRARPSDAGASGASGDEPHPDPLQVLKRDGSHTALRRAHRILAGEGVQKLACRAAFPPMSGPRLLVPCKLVAVPSAA